MSRCIPYSTYAPNLPTIREWLRMIAWARKEKNFPLADSIKVRVLANDDGLRLTISKEGKVSLWHFPNPPFTDHLHYCNYGEFIANSEEE